jgi:protocatechuate 3,4-dioxygenase alpha subunit
VTTPSQTVGPYFALGLLDRSANELAPDGIRITGRVLDGTGEPVSDAMVEIWQADEEGRYRPDFGWGRSGCDAEGRFSFVTHKPGRVQGQSPHLSVLVFARGLLKPVRTRMYFPDEEEANAADPVLSGLAPEQRETLFAAPDDGGLRFDIHLQGPRQTTFFAC